VKKIKRKPLCYKYYNLLVPKGYSVGGQGFLFYMRIFLVSCAFLLSIVAFCQIALQSPLCYQVSNLVMSQVVENTTTQGENAVSCLLRSLQRRKDCRLSQFSLFRGTQTVFQTVSFTNSCLLRILNTIVH